MSVQEFKGRLSAIYDQRNKECNGSAAQILLSLVSILGEFKKFIPDFFSKNGAADNIRHLYSVVRENRFPNKTVKCVDIKNAASVYYEYNKGMLDFITEIITDANYNCDNIDKNGTFKESLAKAKTKDAEFIDSLFGGENNRVEERNLSDALQNIEVLIDFMNEIDTMVKKSQNIINTIENTNCQLVNDSVFLLYNSILKYTYKTLDNIIDVYNQINEAINTEDKPEPKLKIF